MIIHLVKQGEKLSEIAARYGTTTDAIVARNRHRPAVQLPSGERVFASLSAGDEIRVLGADRGAGGFAGMSNPAADYCDELGGKFPDASSGDCTLPDGTVCDEWALFRGQCPGYPAKHPELQSIPVVPIAQPEPWISKPVLAGGLAVLGLALGAGALMFWPKK